MMSRIVVTGVGVVSPVGQTKDSFWEGILAQRNGFSKVRSFDTSGYRVHHGAEIHDFDPTQHLVRQDPASVGRASQLAIAAAGEALLDSGLKQENLAPHEIGVYMGTTSGEPRIIEALNDCVIENRPDESDRRFAELYPCHVIAAHVAREFELAGPNQVIPAACAAGNYAVAFACNALRSGRAKVMLAGGADSFSRITYTGFARLGAISPDVVRPFDKNRRGMIPGEGAGVLVLETEAHARARGAPIYAEVAGYGLSCDAYHMTGPHPEGKGAAEAMRQAMAAARLNESDIDYVSAHGTGTSASDCAESQAIEAALNGYAKTTVVSSIKSMLGHTMGAASAIEAIACALAVKHDVIPPTANWMTRDPECRLDYATDGPRETIVNVALNNANAFGGNNAAVIFRKFNKA